MMTCYGESLRFNVDGMICCANCGEIVLRKAGDQYDENGLKHWFMFNVDGQLCLKECPFCDC